MFAIWNGFKVLRSSIWTYVNVEAVKASKKVQLKIFKASDVIISLENLVYASQHGFSGRVLQSLSSQNIKLWHNSLIL